MKRPAILLLPALFLVRAVAGPTASGPAPDYAQIGALDQGAGRAVIEQFREAGLPGAYYFEFDLHLLPRRGEERVVPGRLWATREEPGPRLRLVLDPGGPNERRWLVQGGARPAAWRAVGPAFAPQAADLFDPLWDGSAITPFDLQMSFLYWPDETLVGVNRIGGRPADNFLFRPPAAFASRHPAIGAVRAYLDTEYGAAVKTELLGPDGGVRKTWTLVDLKQIAGKWIPKETDYRDEATRDKTRIELTGAALDLDFPPSFFDPAGLAAAVNPPSGDSVVRFGR